MLSTGKIKRNRLLLFGKTESKERIFLGVPGKFTLKKDKNAASLLTAVIKVESMMERLISITAESDGEVIFDGIPDEEIYTYQENGVYLKIIARCKKALLIDNEVMPQEIKNPSLRFFSRRFLENYGFRIISENKTGSGVLKAYSGTSVLAFLEDYFMKAFQTRPIILDDGKVYLQNEYKGNKVKIDDRFLLKAEITRRNCDIISEYILPDKKTGEYNLSIKNPEEKGFIRKKYTSNLDEINFETKTQVKITAEGFIKGDIYDEAECIDEKGIIESIVYERDSIGDTTTVTFLS